MDIKVVHYFSDGCAGQYKNCKKFFNLCHNKKDFAIDCEEFHIWLNLFDKDRKSRRKHIILLLLKRLLQKDWLQRDRYNFLA